MRAPSERTTTCGSLTAPPISTYMLTSSPPPAALPSLPSAPPDKSSPLAPAPPALSLARPPAPPSETTTALSSDAKHSVYTAVAAIRSGTTMIHFFFFHLRIFSSILLQPLSGYRIHYNKCIVNHIFTLNIEQIFLPGSVGCLRCLRIYETLHWGTLHKEKTTKQPNRAKVKKQHI